jgi:serine/threonine protein kinase/tetratricopeptide (TPR) repeat protein
LLCWSRGIYSATHRRHSPAFLKCRCGPRVGRWALFMGDGGPINSPSDPLNPRGSPSLTPQRWLQIKELFGRALEREPSQRNPFLQEACDGDEALRKEVESLLASAGGAGAVTSDVFKAVAPQAAEPSVSAAEDPMLGRRIGAYRIDRRIGYGGMAAVYLASRADEQFRMQVAVKLLRPDLDHAELLRRFLNERQTLAALGHPNIVKLLDGGSTEEGLPYLVMDYVEGSPIDEYCDTHSLSIQERLHLFCKVCEAVEHAHEHRVIHRDLKPNNILVTAGIEPKLLDFGIAKVLDPTGASEITRTTSRHLTPAYASPEQVRGEPVTAATDVYSLGVVLYGLLTGHRPYRLEQRTPAAMERAICEQEPESPSTAVNRVETETLPDGTTVSVTAETVSRTREGKPDKLRHSLKGDLDNIVLKALQKDPQRRYRSVAEFAQDIQRHLAHLPIQARPSTFTYRASKFVHRHKTEMIAGAVVVLVLLAAVIFSVLGERQATERARAELASRRSRGRRSVAVLGFKNLSARADTAWLSTALSEMLTTELSAGGKLRTIPGENVAQTKINLSLPEQDSLSPETLNRVYKNLGSDYVVSGSYLDLGDPDRNVRVDLQLQDAALGETVAAIAETGREDALPDLVIRAGTTLRERLGIVGTSRVELASVQASASSNPEALRLYAEGIARLRSADALRARDFLEGAVAADSSFALAHSALADAWSSLGYDAQARQESKQALNLSAGLSHEDGLLIEGHYWQFIHEWDKAIEIYRTLSNFFPDNLDYGLQLAATQISSGKGRDALNTVDALRKLAAPIGDDPRIDLTESRAAASVTDYNRSKAAALQAERKAGALESRLQVAQAKLLEASAMRSLGDRRGAQAASEIALGIFRLAQDRLGEAKALRNLGAISADQGDYDHATTALEESLRIHRELGNRAGEADVTAQLLGVVYRHHDLVGATKYAAQELAIAREVGDQVSEAHALNVLGGIKDDQGKMTDAIAYFQQSLAIYHRIGNESGAARVLNNLGLALMKTGDFRGGEKALKECIAISRHNGDKDDLGIGLLNLADLKFNHGQVALAKKLYQDALQVLREIGDQPAASYALYTLSDIAAKEGDLTAGWKGQQEALTIRERLGLKGDAARSRVSLAEMAIEQGRLAEGESLAKQAAQAFHAASEAGEEVEADIRLIEALQKQGKISEAQSVAESAGNLVSKVEDKSVQTAFTIADAKLRAETGKFVEATKLVKDAIEMSRKNGFLQIEFQGMLALGEIQIKAGDHKSAHLTLTALEKKARAKGQPQVAKQAVELEKRR